VGAGEEEVKVPPEAEAGDQAAKPERAKLAHCTTTTTKASHQSNWCQPNSHASVLIPYNEIHTENKQQTLSVTTTQIVNSPNSI